MERRAAIQIAEKVLMQAGVFHAELNNAVLRKEAGRKVWTVVFDLLVPDGAVEDPTSVFVEVDDATGNGIIVP